MKICEIHFMKNGYRIIVPAEDKEHIPQEIGFVEAESDSGEYDCVADMLYYILEQVKPNSKHNPYRINIEVKKQWK